MEKLLEQILEGNGADASTSIIKTLNQKLKSALVEERIVVMKEYYPSDHWSDPDDDDRSEFADPGGRSALRAGKRIHPCPTCKQPNKLTAKDKAHGYQCDNCADRAEQGGY